MSMVYPLSQRYRQWSMNTAYKRMIEINQIDAVSSMGDP